MNRVEDRGNRLQRNKLRGWISVSLFVIIGGYLAVKPETRNGEPRIIPPATPKIDRHRPAEVLDSRTTSGDGSRLVLKQCLDSIKQCRIETYESRFPDAQLTYPAGSTMELEDVEPPMRFVPQK
jgi:hypothetical protein